MLKRSTWGYFFTKGSHEDGILTAETEKRDDIVLLKLNFFTFSDWFSFFT